MIAWRLETSTGHVVLVLLILLVLLGGCASGGGKGSLSEAAREGSGGNQASGRGEGRTRTKTESTSRDPAEAPYEYETYDFSYYGDSHHGDAESKIKARPRWHLWLSRSHLSGDTIEGFSDVTLMYAGSPDTLSRHSGQIGLYYGRGRLGDRQDIQEEFRWVSEAGLEFGARRYFTRTRPSAGFFLLAGLRFGAMWWSYTHGFSIPSEDGGTETVSGDGTLYGTPYVGLGASFLPARTISLGVSATAGFRWTGNESFKGLENDLFKDGGEYSLNLEASFLL